jgi:hypothetical protein
MHQPSNVPEQELSGTSSAHLMPRLVAKTPEACRIWQLEAELWIERFLNRLSHYLNDCLMNYARNKHVTQTDHNSQVETEIFQTVVNELRAGLGTGVIAIALPNVPPNSALVGQPNSPLLELVQVYKIYHVAPYESRRRTIDSAALAESQPNQAQLPFLAGLGRDRQLRCGLGELISTADLRSLQVQEYQSAWPLSGEQGTLGWLIAVLPQPLELEPTSTLGVEAPLKFDLIGRVAEQCAIAIRQAKLLQTECPQCKKMEARNRELVRANQLKSEFLANTSHEIRTPLSSILGFTHLMREQGYSPSNLRHQEYLNIILTSGQHLLALINDILDLSKIEANQLDLQWETVKVKELCNSVLTLVKEKANDKGLALRLDIDPGATTLVADSLRMKQMLFNLLANALKFTLRGSVGLKVESAGVYLRFTVWDTGTGISKEKQSQLFRPYSQIANAVVERDEGTGLGLALTQKLAELHGGWVELQSELNKGSQFTIVLPLTPEAQASTASLGTTEAAGPSVLTPVAGESLQAEQSVKSVDGEIAGIDAQPPLAETLAFAPSQPKITVAPTRPYHILLIEDHPTNAKLMITYLSKLGYEVTWAKEGKEMWQALKRSRPALIFMDIQLPGVDGLTLIKQLKAHEQFQTIPVIAQTAMAMTGDREICLSAGATDYISKPINLQALAQIMCKYSDRRTT